MKRTSTAQAGPAKGKAPRKPRGRPRSFDRDHALEQAMEVFWKKGFEGASISDLTEAMGINPPSLYAAFGDKEKLFLESIERYTSRRGESCPYCDEATARGAVEKLLLYMADELTSAEHPRGCMMMMPGSQRQCFRELRRSWREARVSHQPGRRASEGIRDVDAFQHHAGAPRRLLLDDHDRHVGLGATALRENAARDGQQCNVALPVHARSLEKQPA
jgi:AcrR family transcriptional regulator